jgi:CubicO group peptidase (beta-lactamase class C family)
MKRTLLFRASLVLAVLALIRFAPPVSAEDEPASSKKIAEALQPFVDKNELAGAVTLVANKDRVLSLDAVGFADIANKTPMKPDALFWIASQSKPITATAFMMLVDEGKVNLDDPVEKYLPEFKGQQLAVKEDGKTTLKAPKHPITVREILSHTSGLPFRSAKETPTLDGLTLADAVRSYAATPLEFEPGSKYQYSNAGINTAGRIIEVVSKMPYEDFLQKRLFDPLGMKDTTFWPNEEQTKRLAKSYKPGKDKMGLVETTVGQLRYPLNDHAKRYPMPAGGLFSTASDVGKFCRMILNGGTLDGKRYLTEKAVKEMTSKQTGDLKEGYGLGWSTGGGNPGHGGAYATNMSIDPKRGLVFVWMVQVAGGYPGEGGKSQGAFRKAADEEFGKSTK